MEEKKAVVSIENLSDEKTRLFSGDRYKYEFQKKIAERGRVEKSPAENQHRLELSLGGAELTLWEVDLEKDTVCVDQSWADIFGHLPEEVQLNTDFWRDLIHPNDRPGVLKAWDEHLDGFTERFEAEHRIRNKVGEWKWLLSRGKTVERTKEGKPLRVSGVALDVTDLKGSEERLHDQIKALERSNKNLEEFAYVAAHDLREPLIGIAAYIKLLERRLKSKLDEEAQKLISRALDTITRMDRLIQGLLWHSRSADDTSHWEATDCNVALEEALASLRSAIEERGAVVESESLPTVIAIPPLFVQVFQNLVSNAIRFAADEPLRVRIGAQRDEKEWLFFVKDNGIGIEPPYFDRIFRFFERVDASPDRPGAGIGLANCKKIVERHGGRIWVESQPGKGSTFFFTIPHRGPEWESDSIGNDGSYNRPQ